MVPGAQLSRQLPRLENEARASALSVAPTVIAFGVAAIWFDDPTRLTTAMGLVTAGLAFALQKVITAGAGYIVILRGKTFNVGDRIVMGGVRGDVIGLDFTQTTIMEMGQPPAVQGADPAMWVRSRQFTGRIVTVTNDKVFDEPVYNYTREFPFIWEEMAVPIPYRGDHARVETILLQAVSQHARELDRESEPVRRALERHYFIGLDDLTPRVFYRLTDNWVELTVRFIVEAHGVREIKDAIARTVLRELAQILRETAREIDKLGRYGGEEFMVVLPGSDSEAPCRPSSSPDSRVSWEASSSPGSSPAHPSTRRSVSSSRNSWRWRASAPTRSRRVMASPAGSAWNRATSPDRTSVSPTSAGSSVKPPRSSTSPPSSPASPSTVPQAVPSRSRSTWTRDRHRSTSTPERRRR